MGCTWGQVLSSAPSSFSGAVSTAVLPAGMSFLCVCEGTPGPAPSAFSEEEWSKSFLKTISFAPDSAHKMSFLASN